MTKILLIGLGVPMDQLGVEHEVEHFGQRVVLDRFLVLLLIAAVEFSVVEVEDSYGCHLADYLLGFLLLAGLRLRLDWNRVVRFWGLRLLLDYVRGLLLTQRRSGRIPVMKFRAGTLGSQGLPCSSASLCNTILRRKITKETLKRIFRYGNRLPISK